MLSFLRDFRFAYEIEMATPVPRDVGPFLKAVRAFFMGRTHTNNLRFPAAVAERPGPQANLPEGESDTQIVNTKETFLIFCVLAMLSG